MTVPVTSAVGAYVKAATAEGPGLEPRDATPGGSFADLVKDAAGAAVEAGQRGEVASMNALAGNADLAEVVTAVANAEVALQTVVAIRDRVIQAYQDIIRMPI